MQVLKITAEGPTTSFRYPFFMQQVHPSYPMPPPATIYGLICGALGEWISPEGLTFAYRFTHRGRTRDKEHIIMLSASSGYLPGTKIPKVLEGKVNPFDREILFEPRLTLYLNRPEWAEAFLSPRYAVCLGRSQDLFAYTRVEAVSLEPAPRAYFEHTLLPYEMGLRTARGISVLMPRYIDNAENRAPVFSRYLALMDRVFTDELLTFAPSSTSAAAASPPPCRSSTGAAHQPSGSFLVDPQSPEIEGARLGLAFLSFTGDDGERIEIG